VPSERNVAGKDGGAVADHIGLHHAGSDIDERHRLFRGLGMVQLILVLDGEGVEVHYEASSPACSTTATYSRILTFFTATSTTDMELDDSPTTW